MRSNTSLTRILVGIACGVLLPLSAACQEPSRDAEADFVVVGEVEAVGSASFAAVPEPGSKVIVKVEQVLLKPDAVALAPGERVTVMPSGRAPAKGTHATFYAKGWIFGEGLALRELRREPLTTANATNGEAAPEQRREEVRMRSAIERADVIVAGRVSSIREAPEVLAAEAAKGKPITEHDPEWREAVVEVRSWLKGESGADSVVVRFPASMDVAWFDAPKLREGQEGTFLLRKDEMTGKPMATLAGQEVEAFTALEPTAVLPPEAEQTVRGYLSPP